MKQMHTLREFLSQVSSLSPPPCWEQALSRIEHQHRQLCELLERNTVVIYGANTLPGHRDEERVTEADLSAFQENMLQSHAIAESPCYAEYTARCISYAKIYSWIAGMSGVSPELYTAVVKLVSSPEFKPQIPTQSTYSSGDVIPAAHWAQDILTALQQDQHYRTRPGEMMALINGSFVHLGYAASLIRKLQASWVLFVEVTALNHLFSQTNTSDLSIISLDRDSWAARTTIYIRSKADNHSENNSVNSVQDPVSLRATPQIMDVLCDSIQAYLQQIDDYLARPSGNPLFDEESEQPLSQASFLAPTLTVKTGALIESLLFSMWSMTGRTQHLLSGKVSGIPQDAATEKAMLGLIQYPKLMMATLEKSRSQYGRRTYASGAQTSYGVEDLWTYGVLTLTQLEGLIDDFNYMCGIELYLMTYIEQHFDADYTDQSELLELCRNSRSPREALDNAQRHISQGGLLALVRLFPVKVE